jgi:hypothetical protein
MKLIKRLYLAAATIAAGFVASHLVKLIWRAISGKKPPEDSDDLTASTIQVTVFAAALAAATAIAQTLASRKALSLFEAHEAEDLAEQARQAESGDLAG